MKKYTIEYYDKDDNLIDSSEVDEINDDLIWLHFLESGHHKLEGDYYEYQLSDIDEV